MEDKGSVEESSPLKAPGRKSLQDVSNHAATSPGDAAAAASALQGAGWPKPTLGVSSPPQLLLQGFATHGEDAVSADVSMLKSAVASPPSTPPRVETFPQATPNRKRKTSIDDSEPAPPLCAPKQPIPPSQVKLAKEEGELHPLDGTVLKPTQGPGSIVDHATIGVPACGAETPPPPAASASPFSHSHVPSQGQVTNVGGTESPDATVTVGAPEWGTDLPDAALVGDVPTLWATSPGSDGVSSEPDALCTSDTGTAANYDAPRAPSARGRSPTPRDLLSQAPRPKRPRSQNQSPGPRDRRRRNPDP